ncbi:glycosyltransferase family 92 protein [uncultured Mailhella sp.]|uniref:glycosyltransferase family 92 protein n=1 Tax=uncultured Mailhella sp. TaxID=1981031 RepID=UPI00262390F9|nr:glycosyltransferase family 92 protein [uncultured Mailhella sp.]
MRYHEPSSSRKMFVRLISGFIPFRQMRHNLRDGFFYLPFSYCMKGAFRYYFYTATHSNYLNKNCKYYLSIVACCKDEGAYIEEWVEYYRLQGVDHFYLYNNNGTDNSKEILKKYIDSGVITWIEWPGKQQQLPIYENAVDTFKYETRWMAIVDLDEFIVPMNKQKLSDVLKTFEYANQILIPWVIYGSSGLKKKTEGLVIERFTKHQRGLWPQNKAIINPRATLYPHVHSSLIFGKTINFRNDETYPRVVINHYVTKSAEEYEAKKQRGDAFFKVSAHTDGYFKVHDRNDVEDGELMREYALAIKKSMRERERERERIRLVNSAGCRCRCRFEANPSSSKAFGESHHTSSIRRNRDPLPINSFSPAML